MENKWQKLDLSSSTHVKPANPLYIIVYAKEGERQQFRLSKALGDELQSDYISVFSDGTNYALAPDTSGLKVSKTQFLFTSPQLFEMLGKPEHLTKLTVKFDEENSIYIIEGSKKNEGDSSGM